MINNKCALLLQQLYSHILIVRNKALDTKNSARLHYKLSGVGGGLFLNLENISLSKKDSNSHISKSLISHVVSKQIPDLCNQLKMTLKITIEKVVLKTSNQI